MFTKCATCHKWSECPYCGACHACRPDVRDACVAVRNARSAQSLLHTDVPRKHQASTFTQDPGIGANGCEPRVTARHRTWYGSPEYTDATHTADSAHYRAERAMRANPHVWVASTHGVLYRRNTGIKVLSGQDRARALYGF